MGWSPRPAPLQNRLHSFPCSSEYPLDFTVCVAAGQPVAATHAPYAFTVTSVLSMQYPDSVTACCGCSSISPTPSRLPIWNVPAGTRTIPPGQLPGAAAAGCDAPPDVGPARGVA